MERWLHGEETRVEVVGRYWGGDWFGLVKEERVVEGVLRMRQMLSG